MAGISTAMERFGSLEQLAEGDSPLHRLHPGAKLGMTLVYAVCVVSAPPRSLSALVPFAVFPLLAMAVSGLSGRILAGRLAAALPFVLFTGLSNLLLDRETLYFLGPLPVSGGLLSCLSLLLKAFLCVSGVVLLVSATSMPVLTDQLARFHVPKVLCLQLTLTYRYIAVLLQQADRMYTAYQLRTGGRRGIRMKDMGCFLGQLLLRSWDRAERVGCAMKCRGFDGVCPAGTVRPISAGELLLTAALCLLFLLLRLVNLSVLLGSLL